MKILLISYDSYKCDGRLRELIRTAEELGEATCVTRAAEGEKPKGRGHILFRGQSYGRFIMFVCRQAARLGRQDIIFIDNRKGILPGYMARRLTGAKYVIQDCRELYDMKSAIGPAGKLGCVVEKLFTGRSDVIIAANAYRAKLMVKMFGLKREPLCYENVRRLNYTSEGKRRQTQRECEPFFTDKKFRIVSTAGCDLSRTTGKMLEAMKGLGEDYELLLIGESESEDELIVRATIRELGLTNVKIFPQMDQDRLKYFIENSQVGMVAYHQRDLNNRYCASGKLYEFLFEGKPVVTSSNPPLKEFCDRCGVGLASDDYEQAIRAVAERYGQWEERVRRYIGQIRVEDNNHRLAEQIRELLKG